MIGSEEEGISARMAEWIKQWALNHSTSVEWTRSEKAQRVEVILSHLPKAVQKKYNKMVKEQKKKERDQLASQKIEAEKWNYLHVLARIEAIRSDMHISDSQAERLEEQLVESLTPHQRLYYSEFRSEMEEGESDSTRETSVAVIILSTCVFIFR
ncbi:hypothetical protein Y032_0031g2291 [Ancylostoma ceylanicum]|nr:hypothetical protein Y032_0031g2291 [Ancylostoma ceylanicum]